MDFGNLSDRLLLQSENQINDNRPSRGHFATIEEEKEGDGEEDQASNKNDSKVEMMLTNEEFKVNPKHSSINKSVLNSIEDEEE